MKLRIAVVGCGRIFPKHRAAIESLPHELELVGICDREASRAEAAGRELRVPAFAGLDEMLAATKPDLVSILTPSGLHAEHAMLAARAKCHVIVEKPMALRLTDADAMLKACAEYGVRLFVVKQNRLNRPVQKLREEFEKGRFGKLNLVTVRVRWARDQAYYDSADWRGTWAYDGGVLANQAAHHVDLLQWFGGEVSSVYATNATQGVRIEADDTALAVIKFKSGALGLVEATTAVRPRNLEGSLSVLGSGGSVVIGGSAVNRIDTWRFVDAAPDAETEEKRVMAYSVEVDGVYGYGHLPYYQGVIASLKTRGGALVDGLEGRKSLELISAIYRSVETGQEVPLDQASAQHTLGVSPGT